MFFFSHASVGVSRLKLPHCGSQGSTEAGPSDTRVYVPVCELTCICVRKKLGVLATLFEDEEFIFH